MHQSRISGLDGLTRPAAGPNAARPRTQPSHVCQANYRWSASSEGGSRRKRESVYGYDDNGEPLAGSAATGDANGSAAAAPGGTRQGDWQAWQQGGGAQPPTAATWDAQQQDSWDAAAALDAVARRRRRERDTDASSSSEARTSRLSQRRRQRLEQQEAKEQQWLAEQEQQEQRVQQQRAQRQAVAQGSDPWVEAELRQLRRRQAGQANGAAAARAAAEGKLPDPWAQEWGPLQGARAAAAAQDWGWGAESWAGGSAATGRRQRREDAAAAGSAPGSSWDLRQQQRELRRRRRRAASGHDEDEEAEVAATAQQAAYAAATNGAQPRYGIDYDAELEGLGPEGEEYIEDNWGEEVPPGSAGWRGRPDGSPYGAEDDGPYSRQYEAGLMTEPDIALLSEDELDQVLPVVPFSQQAAFFSGSVTDGVQRWGASLALTVLFSKVALLAATSLSWPLWWPWALAAKKNLAVRRPFRHGGLWRTQVLEVATTGRPRPFSSNDEGGLLGSTMRMARVLVGDPGGAQAEMRLPYDSRYELIRPGEPAELVVLCNDTSFQTFKAVKDAYLPNSGLWVSEYPHCDRTQFLEVSLQVEREAQEALNAQQQQQQQQPGAAAQQGAAEQQSYAGGEGDQAYYGPTGSWPQEDGFGSTVRY